MSLKCNHIKREGESCPLNNNCNYPSCGLDQLSNSDDAWFMEDISNWNNHRPLLLLALSLTNGDVYEYGAGDGSTPYLRAYCEKAKRHFQSFENNQQWAEKCKSVQVDDWDKMDLWSCSVAFVDLAPGEYRHILIKRLVEYADIIVVHDSEEGGAGNYMLHKIWGLFKYRINFNKTGGGAGATALSNTIDLHKYRGKSLGEFTFDND